MFAEAPRQLGDQLSPRELEILGYLPTALTNREIAERALRVDQHPEDARRAHLPQARGDALAKDAVARARVLGLLR